MKQKHAARIAILILLAGCTKPAAQPAPPPTPTPQPVELQPMTGSGRAELLWDSYGVPHIFARDLEAAMYAFGWSQMRAHRDLLLRMYGQSRGRSAEYWGEAFAASDRWVLTNDIPERAAQWNAQQTAAERSIIDAFVAGINAYATANPDSISPTYRLVLPVAATDVLAHMQRVIHYTFIASQQGVMGLERAWESAGSNGWAIARDRSATRNALLLANPHLPWGDLFTLFEAGIETPQSNAHGVAFVGLPLLGIAFNDSVGWTHTVNTLDGADLYELTLSGTGYLYDGQVRPFEVKQKSLKVRQQDGTVATSTFDVRHSVHGPVVGEKNGKAVALRVTGLDAPHMIEQLWDMMRANSFPQFEIALSRLQLPLFTTIYADHAGNILNVFNGRVPLRTRGDYAYWRGVVPGDSSTTLWTMPLTYDRLPRLHNPPSGWVQNANEPPWTATLPIRLDARQYAPYVAPPANMTFRAIRSARMLSEDSAMTLDRMIAYKFSSRVEEADHILEDVLSAARVNGSAIALEAAGVLERWDRNLDADSRGAVLFVEFARAFNGRAAAGLSTFDVPWTPRAPLATPDGVADPAATARVLVAAAERVKARYGRLDIPWGDVNRLQRDNVDLPANGGPDGVGVFHVVAFDSIAPTVSRATAGDSYIAAVEFGSPVRARTLLTYGNWSQPGSIHRTDQLQLFARKQLKPVWRTRDEVMSHLERREVF